MSTTVPTRATHVDRLRQPIQPFLRFFTGPYAELEPDTETANFAVGNPHELPMPAYGEAVRRHLEPRDRHKVLVLPGTIVEVPGWFRISLTASDEMVERGIPRFVAAMKEALVEA